MSCTVRHAERGAEGRGRGPRGCVHVVREHRQFDAADPGAQREQGVDRVGSGRDGEVLRERHGKWHHRGAGPAAGGAGHDAQVDPEPGDRDAVSGHPRLRGAGRRGGELAGGARGVRGDAGRDEDAQDESGGVQGRDAAAGPPDGRGGYRRGSEAAGQAAGST